MRSVVLLFLVLQISASQTVSPGRRRAVRPNPAPPCALPTLLLTFSKTAVCPGESVTLSWQASDPGATVFIVGVGSSLPASGSKIIDTAAAQIYSGYATNACGAGSATLAEVKLQAGATASVSASPSSIQQGQTTMITVSVANIGSWTLSSTLGNGLSASAGTTSRAVTYTGTRSGSDMITLATTGGCGSLQRTTFISVAAPASGNLRCCDGTLSPTCTSCANKQGCCSSHGGVC